MKAKKILLVSALLSVALAARAQSARELIEQDTSRIACQLHHYEVPDFLDTKAPAGYKPFYVSHFGRHGSRYHTSDRAFAGTVKELRAMDGQGLLTDTGKSFLRDMEAFDAAHQGMGGYLTQRGSKEHQGVATRLYERCPKMFKQKDRKEVLAVSSTVVRCNQSMMNFCTALKGKAPDLDIAYYTNGRTDENLTRVAGGKPVREDPDNGLAVIDSLKRALFRIDRVAMEMFTDTSRAAGLVKGHDLVNFFFHALDLGSIDQCLDEQMPHVYGYFTMDELYAFWRVKNAMALNAHGFSYENREVLRRCGKFIVSDILEKADDALREGSGKVADFRFSHDGGVLPLAFYLKLEKHETAYRLGTEWEYGWYGFQYIPMCTNIQMIFYKNRKGDVLVKFLHNERETTLAEVAPCYGPYYRWTDLRPYLEKLAQLDC